MTKRLRLARLFLLSLIVTSCAGVSPLNSKEKESPAPLVRKTSSKNIPGTAKIVSPGKREGKVYFLYGAEHLKLKNYYFDIPVVYNAAVKKWINYFLSRGKGFFIRYSERAGRYAPMLGKILESHGLPRDLIFLAMAESGFHNKAKSWAKAVGPWQFMPYTGKRYGLEVNWYLDERRDPIKSTIAASRYLKDLYKRFGSWELAAAGYNAGEGKVSRAIRRYRTDNFWKMRRGRYLKSETKNYVPKIMALAIIGKNLSSFGFKEIDFHEPLDFDEVVVGELTDLYKVSESTGIEFDEIHRLNPELMRWHTPPGVSEYRLRLPLGWSKKWKSAVAKTDLSAKDFQVYKVKGKNSQLRHVAKKFKVPSRILAGLNKGVVKGNKLGKGSEVKLPFREGQSRKLAMYSDLYERPSRGVRKWRRYKASLKRALRKGKKVSNPTQHYIVRKGDTLWNISRQMGISIDTIIRSNYSIVKSRMIRTGDRLVIR